ncbi:MAG: SHOCT domain-containing protein [Casimicrobium sp.]
MGYDGGYYMMGGMHGLWWLFWVVLFGVLIFTGWGRSGGRWNRSRETLRDTPHELLHRRLAGGDITPVEYEERKSLLDRDAGPRNGNT